MANYLTYPFKTMRITQSYDGTVSHKPHITGKPSEYALDEGGVDAGRDWFFCPCDAMKVVKIYGVNNKGVNTIWLTSTTKCDLANGKQAIVTMLLTHPNDDDLRKLSVGQTFKRGQAICREGTDGASGNHVHFAIGLGEISGNGWACNTKNKWVLTTTGSPIKPELACYVDKSFTTVKSANGLKFKALPKTSSSAKPSTTTSKPAATKPATPRYMTGNYKVDTDVLRVRAGAGTDAAVKGFSQFTAAAQTAIKKHNGGQAVNGFVRGMEFTALEIKNNWGRCPSGWLCLDYCKKV